MNKSVASVWKWNERHTARPRKEASDSQITRWRTPIIVTTNKWNLLDLAPEDRGWIEANCIIEHIGLPVWEGGHGSRGASSTEPVVTPRGAATKRCASELTPGQSPADKIATECCASCGQRLPLQHA